MTIADMGEQGKRLIATVRHEGVQSVLVRTPRDILIVSLIILITLVSIGTGFLMGRATGEGSVLVEALPLATTTALTALPRGGQVVASRNGSKYYAPWCGGAKRLSAATKIWFASAQDAQAHGYAPAANCPGL